MRGKITKKKRGYIRSLSLVLGVGMLVSGCGNSSVSQTDSMGESGKEPVTITFLTNACGQPGGSDVKDPVIEKLAEVTGVEAKMEMIASQDDLKAKIAAMAASGDLPDVVWLNPADSVTAKQQIEMLLNADAVYDMTDLIETNGKNFLENETLNYAVNYVKKFFGGENQRLYAIPTGVGAQSKMDNPSVGPYIRWDYYKELGYPTVNNEEDLLAVLEQIQKNHPTAANGKKAYAISFFVDWGLESPSDFSMLDGIAQNQIILKQMKSHLIIQT